MFRLPAALAVILLAATIEGTFAGAQIDTIMSPSVNCSAKCMSSGRARSMVCDQVCDAVETIPDKLCREALFTASNERVDLLSYSNGHVAEMLALLISSNLKGSAENAAEFISTGHLVDFGSAEGCAAIEDAQTCVTGAQGRFEVGLCLPRSCDFAVVARLVGNTTTGIFLNSNSTGKTRSSDDGDSPIGVICGDEGVIVVDAGTLAVFSLIGVLVALGVAGTAFDHRRRNCEAMYSKQDNTANGSSAGGCGSNHEINNLPQLQGRSPLSGASKGRNSPVDLGERDSGMELSWTMLKAEDAKVKRHPADHKQSMNRSQEGNNYSDRIQRKGASQEQDLEELLFLEYTGDDEDVRNMLLVSVAPVGRSLLCTPPPATHTTVSEDAAAFVVDQRQHASWGHECLE